MVDHGFKPQPGLAQDLKVGSDSALWNESHGSFGWKLQINEVPCHSRHGNIKNPALLPTAGEVSKYSWQGW